jgi:hypothetical protein
VHWTTIIMQQPLLKACRCCTSVNWIHITILICDHIQVPCFWIQIPYLSEYKTLLLQNSFNDRWGGGGGGVVQSYVITLYKVTHILWMSCTWNLSWLGGQLKFYSCYDNLTYIFIPLILSWYASSSFQVRLMMIEAAEVFYKNHRWPLKGKVQQVIKY